jgi:hypothetical protein
MFCQNIKITKDIIQTYHTFNQYIKMTYTDTFFMTTHARNMLIIFYTVYIHFIVFPKTIANTGHF